MKYKNIQAVTKEGRVLAMQMEDAIDKGFLRLASRVYVFNCFGDLLVQQRSKNVLKPLLLDQSAAGHVDEGETFYETAVRELEEELGLSGFLLEEVANNFVTTDFVNTIYKLVVKNDIDIVFDPQELAGISWYKISELESQMKREPEKFTPAFLEVWGSLRDKLVV